MSPRPQPTACRHSDLALEGIHRRIEAGLLVVINGFGTQRRDLTLVADVVRAVEPALRWRGGGSEVMNVGTHGGFLQILNLLVFNVF